MSNNVNVDSLRIADISTIEKIQKHLIESNKEVFDIYFALEGIKASKIKEVKSDKNNPEKTDKGVNEANIVDKS